MLALPAFALNYDAVFQEGVAPFQDTRVAVLARQMTERVLMEGVGRNFEAAQTAADSFAWPWLVNAVETIRLERQFSQGVQLSPVSTATLPPSTVPSQDTSKATTEAEVSALFLPSIRTF